MKNKIYHLLCSSVVSLALMTTMSACEYLDQKPDNMRTTDMIWETRADAEAYLYNIYGYIWTPADDFSVLGVSDESSVPTGGLNARKMIEGNWGPSNTTWDYWPKCYQAIRSSLTFDKNIDRVPADKISDVLKKQYKAESSFLRGWFYWKLLQNYGPFVIIKDPVSMSEDYKLYERATFDDCVEHICKLMIDAKRVLPVEWSSSANYGRPTQGACLAVISQVRLLAASELWNGNPLFSNFKSKSGVQLAPLTPDPDKWEVAAEAAKDVIYLDCYRLFKNTEEGDATFDPYLSFRNLFLNNWNDEIVFSTNMANSWQWGYDKRCSPAPGGFCMQNATQNIVDAFYTRKGLDINDDPDYKETGFALSDDPAKYGQSRDGVNRGYSKGESNMYVNREARFYVSINYNGQPVLPAPNEDDRNFYSSDGNKDGRGRTEYYYSGLSGAKSRNTTDLTGYNILKKVSPAGNIRVDQSIYRPYIHIRYAEILLNYIEALNEYNPASQDIIIYLNMIRERAGIDPIQTCYPDDLGDTELMRKHILRERQIELAFEGDRYWTLCRRRLFEKPETRKIWRMNVNADDAGQKFAFEGFYTRTPMPDRFWDNKMYLFPISQYELNRGRGLNQNPGWGK